MLRAVQAMYTVVKSIIKCHNVSSEPFQSMQGVKQGDPLSHLMFIFLLMILNVKLNLGLIIRNMYLFQMNLSYFH